MEVAERSTAAEVAAENDSVAAAAAFTCVLLAKDVDKQGFVIANAC